MARLYTEYTQQRTGDTILVEIHDREGVGGDHYFCTRPEGAVIRLEGSSRNTIQTIQPSSCEISIRVDDPAHEAFIEDLALAQENRFWMRVYQRVDRGFITIFTRELFRGNLIIDDVLIEDTHSPRYWITVAATDGLADLKNHPYADEDGNIFEGRERITEHLARALSKISTFDIFNNKPSTAILQDHSIIMDVHPDEDPDPNVCPLYKAYVGHEVFHVKKDESVEPVSCYDVVDRILTAFDLRMYTAGVVFIQSWTRYSDLGTAGVGYKFTDLSYSSYHSYIGRGLPDRETEPPSEICEGVREGGHFALTAPARSVVVRYHHTQGTNFLQGQDINIPLNITHCFKSFVAPTIEPGTRFRFTATLRTTINPAAITIPKDARLIFQFTFHWGDHYWAVNHDVTYRVPSGVQRGAHWRTDPSLYQAGSAAGNVGFVKPEQFTTPTILTDQFEIISEAIPVDASGKQVDICVKAVIVLPNGNYIFGTGISIRGNLITLALVDDDETILEEGTQMVRLVNSIKNNVEIERDTYIGDGPHDYSPGRITLDEDGELSTTSWTGAGVSGPLHEWLAQALMSRKTHTTRIKEGLIQWGPAFTEPFIYYGRVYVPLIVSHETARGLMTGEWAEIRLGEVAGFDKEHSVIEMERPGLVVPSAGDTAVRDGLRELHAGPLTHIVPEVDLTGLLDLDEEEQAKIVELYRKGVRQLLDSSGGIDAFHLVDLSGKTVLELHLPGTPADSFELKINL